MSIYGNAPSAPPSYKYEDPVKPQAWPSDVSLQGPPTTASNATNLNGLPPDNVHIKNHTRCTKGGLIASIFVSAVIILIIIGFALWPVWRIINISNKYDKYTGYNPTTTTRRYNPTTTRSSYNPTTTRSSYNPTATTPSYNPTTTRSSYNPTTTTSSYNPTTTRSRQDIVTYPTYPVVKDCDLLKRFQCRRKEGGCIPLQWTCDGVNDCGDNSDEEGCKCDPLTEVPCLTEDTGCVKKSKVCDYRNDCPYDNLIEGYYDEILCSYYRYCYNEFRCASGGQCLPSALRCDGIPTCVDGSDEVGCPCTKLQTKCLSDGKCINIEKWCDGQRDCKDNSDENLNCTSTCPTGAFKCATGGKCVNNAVVCDRINDCLDGSDETNCSGCSANDFQCNDRKCIDEKWLCDGKRDCSNGEDETQPSCSKCLGSQFQCVSGDTSCLLATQQCDGVEDCTDGSDEGGCVSNGAWSAAYPGSETAPLSVTFRGIVNSSVCSDNWNKSWGDLACKQMGYEGEQASNTGLPLPPGSNTVFVNSSAYSQTRSFLSSLTSNGTCSGTVVGVSCKPRACGVRAVPSNQTGSYIINGQEAARGAWPWQVYLLITTTDGISGCGGSIINNRWILTAAHCVDGVVSPTNVSVEAGTLRVRVGDVDSRILQVDKVIQHPLYEDNSARNVIINDVALLRLAQSITFSETIRPVCAATADVQLNKFKVCVASGWGLTRSDAMDTPMTLRQGKMMPMTPAECRLAYTSIPPGYIWRASNSDFEKIVCAGNNPPQRGTDTCQGDSGGPLVCQDQQNIWTLIGVTSFGFKECQLNVFARVSYFNSWINQQIALNP